MAIQNKRTIVAMLSVYDEADIIGAVVENLLAHDVSVAVLDNGSSDGSYEICESFARRDDVTLERWSPSGLDLELLSFKLFRLAACQKPDWLIFSDGDEILETASDGRTLRQAIEKADGEGNLLMQCDRFDFFWTDADDATTRSPVDRLEHYSWQGDYNFRAFRNVPGLRAAPSFAHYPLFPPECRYRIAPERLVLRHYPYRSHEHAARKIDNLIRKFDANPAPEETWQKRYRQISAGGLHLRPVDHHLLARRHQGDPWNRDRLYAPFVGRQHTAGELFTADGFLRERGEPRLDWDATLARDVPRTAGGSDG